MGQLFGAGMLAPIAYTFVWFSVFGGTGLKMEQYAIADGCLGRCTRVSKNFVFDRKWCKISDNVGMKIKNLRAELEEEADQQLFLEKRPGGCESIIQLSTREVATMWFDVLRSSFIALSSLSMCLLQL